MTTIKKAATATCLIVLTMALTSLPSCKKSGTDNNSTTSNKSLLTAKTWTSVKFEYQEANGTWIPDPDAQDADQFTVAFNTNNTILELHPLYGYSYPGTWLFSTDGTQITITGGDDAAGTFIISQLTESTLLLTDANYPKNGVYIDERLTYTH